MVGLYRVSIGFACCFELKFHGYQQFQKKSENPTLNVKSSKAKSQKCEQLMKQSVCWSTVIVFDLKATHQAENLITLG